MNAVKRNIMIQKAGGNAGKNSVGYKLSLPARMVKEMGITPEDRKVILSFENGEIRIRKDISETE